jgi:hypothetical protein
MKILIGRSKGEKLSKKEEHANGCDNLCRYYPTADDWLNNDWASNRLLWMVNKDKAAGGVKLIRP